MWRQMPLILLARPPIFLLTVIVAAALEVDAEDWEEEAEVDNADVVEVMVVGLVF